MPSKMKAELEDARDLMHLATVALERWRHRLATVAQGLPETRFEEGTDEPLNLSAAWQGQLQGLIQDELDPAIATLRRIAEWSEGSWDESQN